MMEIVRELFPYNGRLGGYWFSYRVRVLLYLLSWRYVILQSIAYMILNKECIEQ